MTGDWDPFEHELDRWAQSGRQIPIWWRDDDAIQASAQLDRLVALSDRLGMPVHLAVIPALAKQSLADTVAATPGLVPVVHGWAHENHAPPDVKKAEFGAHRPTNAMLADAGRGLTTLRTLFGPDVPALFVPPWNRIAPSLTPALPGAGYAGLSTFAPRRTAHAAPGLEQVNTHVDPIDWRGSRGLSDPQTLIVKATQQLGDRREGRADASEPFGILTHHLVHDDDIWQFTENLISRLVAGPVRQWSAHSLMHTKDAPT